MASFSLKKPWVKLVVNSKFIFYNPEDDLVTYHPPFPISQLDSFLKFYNFQINVKKFKSLLNPKNKDEINLEEDDDGTYDEGITSPKATINKTEPLIPWKIDTFPITNENKLREIKKLSETESLQKVLYFIFKNKYGVLPNYQYSNKEKMSEQVCVIKVKETSVFVGKAKSNRSLAKMSADKQALKVLVPALYDELKQSLITGVNSGFSSSLSPKNQQQKKFLRIKRQPKRKITSKTQSTMSTNVSMSANINITNGDSLNSSTSQSSQEPLSHNDLIKLEIDDPLIVDQFMGCFKYSPMNLINILQAYCPQYDIQIKVLLKTKDNNPSYCTEIDSIPLKIKVEEVNQDKQNSLQYCAQKFLKLVYAPMKVTKYSQLASIIQR